VSEKSQLNAPSTQSHLVALAAYTVLTILLTYPLVPRLNTHLAGDNIDVWINPWANWWMRKAITERIDLYYTDYLFYPQGVSLVFHSFSPLNTVFWWLLEPLCGTIASYNLTILLAYILSGYGMWRLARYWTGSGCASFLAGVVFAFSPYHIIESAHPTIASTQWMPLFALYLIKTVREGRIRHGCLGAFFLVLTALSSWHLFNFSVLWAMLYLVYTALFRRGVWKWGSLKALTVLGVLSLLSLFPLFYPILREWMTGSISYMSVALDVGVGNHLLDFFLPSRYHPFLSEMLAQADQVIGTGSTRPAFVGYIVLLLSLHAALKGGARSRFWTLAASIFVLLSLGPRIPLRTGEVLVVPWAAPVVALWRHPLRFNVLISFCLSILAASDLAGLLQKVSEVETLRREKRRQTWITGIVTSIVLFEYLTLPFPTTYPRDSPFYHRLAEEEGDFAVVEIPIGRQPDKYSMYYQTLHGKRLVGGVVSRTPIDAYNYIAPNPLLYAAHEGNPWTLSRSDADQTLAQLANDDIRYVILKKYFLEDSMLYAWRALFDCPPIYEDAMLVVYPTTLSTASRAFRRGLATRAQIRTPLSHLNSLDLCTAAWTRLPLSPIDR
jgi:hypothetical protein